jgi:uncharacterized membrane protein YsdA (DUF1294 family)
MDKGCVRIDAATIAPAHRRDQARKQRIEPRGTKAYNNDMRFAAAAYVIVVIVMSVACFIAYGWDKRQAINGGRRVSERTLHVMAFLGGWPGALIGQQQFRHKTQKVAFRIVFWMVVAIHVAIVSAVAYAIEKSQQ